MKMLKLSFPSHVFSSIQGAARPTSRLSVQQSAGDIGWKFPCVLSSEVRKKVGTNT